MKTQQNKTAWWSPASRRLARLATFALAVLAAGGAWADTGMKNPVTGETETYVNTLTGSVSTVEWNDAGNWDTGNTPFISGNYDPALVSNRTVSTSTAIDGWTLRVGAYNGASVTWSGGISKIQAGSVGCWLTADETSSITIASFAGNQLEGSDSAPFKLTSANAGGITWSAGITSASNTSLPFWYYLTGAGTVVYGGNITVANAQVIKQADITLSGTSQVASKTLVTFGSGTTKAFTADATINVKNSSGAVVKQHTLSTVNSSGTTTLTTGSGVGACELVQTSTGIVLYWVDGDPTSVYVSDANKMLVLGDEKTICSAATTLNQLGISTLTGTINFYTPAGCTAGDSLIFSKVEMLKATSTPTPANTITITVDGIKYTSLPVVETSAPTSLGNLTTDGINNCNLYTYTFPNVVVKAGQSYDVRFNTASDAALRCRMENTASGAVFTAPAYSGWKPYGVVTVSPIVSTSPVAGSRVILSNTGSSAFLSPSGAAECQFGMMIPAMRGLPAGSVVRVKNVSLASWNDTFQDFDKTNHKSDPYFIKINNTISKSVKNTSSTSDGVPSIDLTNSKIKATDGNLCNRLFFEYANECDLTVGTAYAEATGSNGTSTGLTLLYRNGNLCYGSSSEQAAVRHITAASALSTASISGAAPVYEMLLQVISKPSTTATIDTATEYTLTGLFSSIEDDSDYVINVTESATLNIDTASSALSVTFNITDGKTLTLTGSNTLTATAVIVNGGTLVDAVDIAANITVNEDSEFVINASRYDCKAWALNAVAGVPYRMLPMQFATINGSVTIDSSSVDLPDGYSYDITNTSQGPVMEFITDKQFGSLNINFSGKYGANNNEAARVSDNDSYSGLMHGASPVIGTSWNDVPAQNATDLAIAKYVRQDGSVASDGTATITLSQVNNPYDVQTEAVGDRILYGYCDDSKSPKVVIKNIPFAKYRVIAYAATDTGDTTFCPKTINGVSYSTAAAGSSATPTVSGGTGAWGDSNSRSTLAEGVNYLVSDVIEGTSTVTIDNIKTAALGRAAIPAVQIVEVGVDNTYDIDAAGTYNLADMFPSVSNGYLCEINVNESATLNIGDLSGTIAFNVASGKALTISGSGSITTSASILPNSGGMDLSGNTLTIANASGTVIASDSITIGNSGLQIPLSSNLPYHTIMMKVEDIPSTASRLLGWAVNYGGVASSLDNYLSYTGSNLEQHFYYGKVWETTYGSTAWTRDASEHWVAISYARTDNEGSQTAKGVRSYLDGTEKVVGTDLNWPSLTTDKILIGGIALNSAEPATGMIVKDVHVYNDALTAGQVATVTAALNKGWTVGASGTALTSATLRELPGNDSVLVSGAMTVKSDGSLAFANGVSIKLPAEATLPYQIASSGNCWVDNVSLQIGEETPSTVTIRIENGYIVGTATPRTISSDENLGSLDVGKKYFINVTDDATVTIDQDVSAVGYVVFNVSAGKVLKLDETAHSLDCPYEIIADPFSIAASDTKTFTAGTAVEWYPQIGSATTGNGAISSSGTTIAIKNASSLSAGNYTLVRWVTPQKMSSGYGYVDSLDTTGLDDGLTAELVYCVDRIVLRVYNTAAQAAKGTIKIWPYGDSITEGFNAGGTKANYRVLLAQKLSLLGFNVEMVGCYGQIDQADGTDPSGQAIPDAWKWHSAKHGATAGPTTSAAGRANLCENVDTLCAQAGNPDVVLLLVGANDIVPATGLSAQRVVSSITNIVAHLVANLPDSKIVVGNQLGVEEGYNSYNYNHVVSMIPQVNNLLDEYFAALPAGYEGRVFFADLNTYVKSGEYAVLYGGDHLHPDWLGHDQMAEGWLSVVTNQFTAADEFNAAVGPAVSSSELGAATKSELAAYRKGFNLCRRIDVPSNIIDTSDPYAASGDGVTANIEKVGYFVEYVRGDNNAHKWVWVDMDAFGTTLADVGLPNATHQQVVTSLHVKSNHNGIEDVAADDDTVTGFVEFSPYDYVETASSGVSGAPANNGNCCDWNDQISESGSYGSMQVHRISPSVAADGITRGGQVLFAYNNWQSTTSVAEFGIGNFSSHFYRGQSAAQSFDYTYTAGAVKMNANAYSVKRIEIWTKAVYTAEMSGDSNFSALTFSPTLPSDISECDLVVNVTNDATLTFDAEKSVGTITFNIAANKTLTLGGTSNLTVGKVVVSGPGKLAFTASPEFGALRIASNATIALTTSQSITLTGALTVDTGVTLTMEPASINSHSAAMISAGSVVNNGTVALTAPDSDSDYSVGISGTAITLRRVTKEAFTYNPVPGDNTPTGWITGWGGESFATTSLRVGPSSDTPYVYHVASGNHPWSSLGAKTAPFSIAFYADLSKLESGNRVLVAFGTSSNGLIIYKNDDAPGTVRVGRASGGTIGNGYISVEYPKTGYHLYTVTCAADGTLCAYVDDGSVYKATNAEGTKIATGTFEAGFQIGSTYQGNINWMSPGVGMALCAVRGYDAVLQPVEVETLSESFPATDGNVTWNVTPDNSDNTVIVTSTTFGDSNYLGQSKGTLTIPEGSTVNVKHIRVLNNSSSSDSATVNIAGTLNITSESTNPNTWADRESNKGVLFGHWAGQATYNITGSLLAENTYIETVYTASTQLLDISGGTVKTKALYANNGNSTVKLRDGGTLEVSEILSSGSAITKEFKYGTFRITADATETRAINFSAASGYATTLDPYGHTLTLESAALTGTGNITVADSSDSHDGKVVFVGGSGYTGRLILTDANAANIDISDYTGKIVLRGTASTTIEKLDGFTGVIVIDAAGEYDATTIDLSGATIEITNASATLKATAGCEGNVAVVSGNCYLYVDNNIFLYDGHIFTGGVNDTGATLTYYHSEAYSTTPLSWSEGDVFSVSELAEVKSGNNIAPYFKIFVGHADGDNLSGSMSTATDWNGLSAGDPAPTTGNMAIRVTGGKTLTVDVPSAVTFGEVQVFGSGTVVFTGAAALTVTKGMYVTPGTVVKANPTNLAFSGDGNPGIHVDYGLTEATSGKVILSGGTSESPYAPYIYNQGAVEIAVGAYVSLANQQSNVSYLTVSGTATVRAATSNLDTLTITPTGVLDVPAGATVSPQTLIVNGTVNMTSTSVLSGTTSLSGVGTVNWNGKNPDLTLWTTGSESTGWRGTNSVCNINTSSGAGANRKFESWGNAYSVVKVANVGGWVNAEAGGTSISTEVRFESGSEYAFNLNNGNSYSSTSGQNRWTVFDKVSGSGVITNTTETRPLLVFKNSLNYTGSIRMTPDSNGPIIAFSMSGTQRPATAAAGDNTAGNRIYVMSDGHAVIGDGNDWYASHGITISGTNELVGAGSMTGPVTLNGGAQINLASSPLVVNGTLTLPASGTVTINPGSIDLTSPDGVALITGVTESEALTDGTILSSIAVSGHTDLIVAAKTNTSDSGKRDIVVYKTLPVTEDSTSINVSVGWAKANAPSIVSGATTISGLQSDLATRTGANGYTYYKSYALGLTPATATSKAMIGGGYYEGSKLVFTMPDVIPPTGVTLTVKVQQSTDGSTWSDVVAGEGDTVSVTRVGDGATPVSGIIFTPSVTTVKYYRLNVSIASTATP